MLLPKSILKNYSLLAFSVLIWLLNAEVTPAYAQDFNYGQITPEDYRINRTHTDSNANAIVIREFGKSSMILNERDNRIHLVFEYHVKIKILNKEGFRHANVTIPAYRNENYEETLTDIKASTYNYQDGAFEETAMDKKAIFTERRTRYLDLHKFTLPNLKEGSVIEYSYRIQSPNIFNFRSWEFQSDIPKIISEYQVFIPAIYNYNVTLRGYYKLSEQKSEVVTNCIRLDAADIDCSKISYIMKDIPAFIEEEYMTAASNFKSAIYFELSDIQRLGGGKQSFTKTWRDIDNELVGAKEFGQQMKRKEAFKELIPVITKGTVTETDKAKVIFNYFKKQVKWNNYYGIMSSESIKQVLENRSGSVADINLALIAALSAAGLDAEAVILSTRENGLVNNLYPVISEFNYVVAKVNINDQFYLLDATEPFLPFGLLPLRCINDKGRVINLKKASYPIDLKASQKSITTYVLNGNVDTAGRIKGQLSIMNTGYEALNRRKEIKKYNSAEEYIEKFEEQLPKMRILKGEISGIDSLDLPLTENYEIEINLNEVNNASQVYFNPFFINRISKNPFNLNQRTYPVDLGSERDERIIINIGFTEPYELLEKPADIAISLPENTARYTLRAAFVDNRLMLNEQKQFNKAVYTPDEYLYLKAFISKIIQNQKTDFILKKNR